MFCIGKIYFKIARFFWLLRYMYKIEEELVKKDELNEALKKDCSDSDFTKLSKVLQYVSQGKDVNQLASSYYNIYQKAMKV